MARKRFRGTLIWNTYGDWVASEVDGHIWDLRGDWIGWIDENKDVYKADGEWLGTLSKDGRVIRKRTAKRRDLVRPPARPEKPDDLPVRAPLPPPFAELEFSQIDVLDEDPDAFKRLSDLRPDME